jgi:23S rRNA (cytidine1920-2'-O)/16S rRNA (cytidine1409-2'-O)-methyltransferase
MDHKRADLLLVAQGLAESRTRARSLIEAGHVTSGGRAVAKPGEMLPADAPLAVTGTDNPYVSRGGLKLAFALDQFGIAVQGKTALDLGASTGGFTQVLLERGAARVYAVDVGHGQLHPRIAGDPRVVALEGTDARSLTAQSIPEPPDLITADLSFIGLAKALPVALKLAAPGAVLIALVKPQFEVGPAGVGKGGIVKDPAARDAALAGVQRWLAEEAGWTILGATQSPITGGDGNVEFLLAAKRNDG